MRIDKALETHEAALRAATDGHPLLQVIMCHHENFRGGPMRLWDRPYLVEWLTDMPTLRTFVCQKAVQTSATEILIAFILERTGWAGRVVAYVLPSDRIRDRFVHTRIDPLLARVPAYRERLPGGLPPIGFDADGRSVRSSVWERPKAANLRLKQFGPGTLMFLGSNAKTDFLEFSADVLIVDELDRCDKENLSLAKDRIRESSCPQEIYISNPTTPNHGIAPMFNASDRRRWHFRCSHCGHRQHIEWERHIVVQDNDGAWIGRDIERWRNPDLGDIRPICSKCGRPFDRVGEGGLWVPEVTSVGVHRGYQMSRMALLSQNIRDLVIEWNEAHQRGSVFVATFHRSILGEAYEGASTMLGHEDLERTATGPALGMVKPDDLKGQAVTMGVDVGAVLNVVVSRISRVDGVRVREAVHVGIEHTFEDVEALFRRMHVQVCVVDIGPETRLAKVFRDNVREDPGPDGGVVWLCQYHNTDRVGSEDYGLVTDWENSVVTVDRTQLLDATMDDHRGKVPRRAWPRDVGLVPGFVEQMRASHRMLNQWGRFVWDEGSAPDHYRHADAYDRVAADILNMGGGYYVIESEPTGKATENGTTG